MSVVAQTLVGITMLGPRAGANRRALDAAQVAPGNRLVDIGCGPGSAVRAAARRGLTVVGVDPSPVMLDLARLVTTRGLRPRVDLRIGSAEALPLDDVSVDAAIALHSVHHWPDAAAGFTEVHRVLVPGGRLVVVERIEIEGQRAHHGVSAAVLDGYAEAIAAAGFDAPIRTIHRDRSHRAVLVAMRHH